MAPSFKSRMALEKHRASWPFKEASHVDRASWPFNEHSLVGLTTAVWPLTLRRDSRRRGEKEIDITPLNAWQGALTTRISHRQHVP